MQCRGSEPGKAKQDRLRHALHTVQRDGSPIGYKLQIIVSNPSLRLTNRADLIAHCAETVARAEPPGEGMQISCRSPLQYKVLWCTLEVWL